MHRGVVAVRVVVVGAGIGGLTLALALHGGGSRPLLLERASALEAAGAGVQLGPNAVRLLFALGLEPALRSVATTPRAAEVRDGASGRLLFCVPLGDEAERRWGAPYLQLHRADLQEALLAAIQDRHAADLRLGAEVVHVDDGGVTLADGERIAADLVVGADGVRSRVRTAVCGASPPRPLGETAWRALIPIAPHDAPAAVVWTWPRRHLVAYPVSGGARLNLVAVTPGASDDPSWSTPGDPAALRAAFADAGPDVRALLSRVDAVSRWALADTEPLPRWSDGAAVLLGDAAHATAPYLAQGAAMAVEDAESLARHLTKPGPLAARLAAYEAERRPRTTRVQAASRRNGTIFHLPNPVAALGFSAATVADRLLRRSPAARLDWLYGYRPPT